MSNQKAKGFDEVLQKINYYITLKDDDRNVYTKDFDAIKDRIIYELKNEDIVFSSLFNGPNLGGSYADKLKIGQPNEFDLVLKMKLTASTYAVVENAEKCPGFVTIYLGNIFNEIKNQKQHKTTYEKLKKLVDNSDYLAQDKVQCWIQSIFSKILQKNDNKFVIDGHNYNLKYKRSGPAHTITFEQRQQRNFISVDFVPAFVFDKCKWTAEKQPPQFALTDWIAVPKSTKNSNKKPDIYFQTSYVDTERIFLQRKNTLKTNIRMLKKLRDRHNIQNLKSYFIKTVFLWENDTLPEEFWKKSVSEVLLHMFGKLVECVEIRKMLFYWHPRQNMFDNLNEQQLTTMCGQLKKIYHQIVAFSTTDPEKLYNVFLTKEEITDMNSKNRYKEITNLLELNKTNSTNTTNNHTYANVNNNNNSNCILM